ncbi:MAG: hypothetical protein ABI601_15800 [bacterium]
MRAGYHIVTLLALAAVSACSSDVGYQPITGAVAEPTGTYMLLAVDGAPLPFDVGSGPTGYTILSSTLSLAADGTWIELRKELAPGPRIIRSVGRWTQQGFGLSLVGASGVAYAGSMTNTGLRLADAARGYNFIR